MSILHLVFFSLIFQLAVKSLNEQIRKDKLRVKKKVKRYLRKKKLEYIQQQQKLKEEYSFLTPPPKYHYGSHPGDNHDSHDKRVRFHLPLEVTPPTLMAELRTINLERELAEQRLAVESLTKANQDCLQQIEQYKTLLMKESRKVQESRQDYMELVKSKKKGSLFCFEVYFGKC